MCDLKTIDSNNRLWDSKSFEVSVFSENPDDSKNSFSTSPIYSLYIRYIQFKGDFAISDTRATHCHHLTYYGPTLSPLGSPFCKANTCINYLVQD